MNKQTDRDERDLRAAAVRSLAGLMMATVLVAASGCAAGQADGASTNDSTVPAAAAAQPVTSTSSDDLATAPAPDSTTTPTTEPESNGSTPDGDKTFVIEEIQGTTLTDLNVLESFPCGEGLERETGPFTPEVAGEVVDATPIVDGDVQRTGYFTRCRTTDRGWAQAATLFFYEEPFVEVDRDGDEAAIATDLEMIVASFDECLTAMPSCDSGGPGRWRTGTQRSLTEQQIATWNANGYHVRDVETRAYSTLSISVDEDGVASVEVCETDSSVVYIPASAGLPEQIIDDESVRLRQTWQLVQIDDRWLATDIVDRVSLSGEQLCEHEES